MSAPRTSWRMSWMKLQGQLMARRKALGLTQPEVASKLLVSLSTFKRWELGHAAPGAMELFRWADLLGIGITSEVHAESVSDDTSSEAA